MDNNVPADGTRDAASERNAADYQKATGALQGLRERLADLYPDDDQCEVASDDDPGQLLRGGWGNAGPGQIPPASAGSS